VQALGSELSCRRGRWDLVSCHFQPTDPADPQSSGQTLAGCPVARRACWPEPGGQSLVGWAAGSAVAGGWSASSRPRFYLRAKFQAGTDLVPTWCCCEVAELKLFAPASDESRAGFFAELLRVFLYRSMKAKFLRGLR